MLNYTAEEVCGTCRLSFRWEEHPLRQIIVALVDVHGVGVVSILSQLEVGVGITQFAVGFLHHVSEEGKVVSESPDYVVGAHVDKHVQLVFPDEEVDVRSAGQVFVAIPEIGAVVEEDDGLS